MHKPSKAFSVLLTILIPLVIFILSSNLILRMPLTYKFYFNDSMTINKIDYSITVSKMGNAISGYFSKPGTDTFQVYEQNGSYKDGVFKSDEQKAMKKARDFVNLELMAGIVLLLLSLLIYVNTCKKRLNDILRIESWIAMGVTVLLFLLQLILMNISGFRHLLYSAIVGVKLSKTSSLYIIMGGGDIYGTYLEFSTICGLILLLLFAYVSYRHTRPDRIFY